MTELMFPPARFGIVNGGVYRGGYPVLRNFKFLHKTGIKVLTLILIYVFQLLVIKNVIVDDYRPFCR